MESYHGTSSAVAANLTKGKVDVTLGGGELGRGFYTGEHLYLAKAWAKQVTGDAQRNVVRFEVRDNDALALSIKSLDHGAAALVRSNLRRSLATRTYEFGVDAVWAPIVGSEKVTGDQYKWESAAAEGLLNGPLCSRSII